MYDYEEEFTTEEQDIVDEAVEKFREVLINRRREEWENFYNDREIFKKNKADFYALKAAFEKEKKAFEVSRDTLYAQFKKDWFDTLGFQFKVGDRVWYAKAEYEKKECPVCKGKKTFKVQTPYGDEVTCKCPKCEGKGYISSVVYHPWMGTITEISMTVIRNKTNCYVKDREVFANYNKCEVWVIPDEILTESFYRSPDKLYHTKEECEAVIEQEKEEKEKK